MLNNLLVLVLDELIEKIYTRILEHWDQNPVHNWKNVIYFIKKLLLTFLELIQSNQTALIKLTKNKSYTKFIKFTTITIPLLSLQKGKMLLDC